MNKALGNALKLIFFLGLGIFLVWLITHNLTPRQWQRIKEAFQQANYWILIPVFIIGALSHFFRALRWRLFMRPMGYRPGILATFSAVMIGYIANLAIPRMGEITRCGVLSRNERIPFDKVLGTMIAERVIDLISLFILLAVAILIQINIVGEFFYNNVLERAARFFYRGNIIRNTVILAGAIAVIVMIGFILKKFRHTQWYRRLRLLMQGINKGIFALRRLDQKGIFIFYTLAIWVCYFLMVYIGFLCLKPTAVLGVKAALSILGFGSIGMIITQGGIGAYQLIVEKTLELYGILEAYGFAFAWLSWLTQTLLILVLGVICTVALPFLKRKEASKSNTLP
jgi:uncharacterized protein (TIRG00374 family)